MPFKKSTHMGVWSSIMITVKETHSVLSVNIFVQNPSANGNHSTFSTLLCKLYPQEVFHPANCAANQRDNGPAPTLKQPQ